MLGSVILKKQYKEAADGNIKYIKKVIIGTVFTTMGLSVIIALRVNQVKSIRKAQYIQENNFGMITGGKPENYHAMPKGRHDTERFDIGGVHFVYGYGNAASFEGIFHPENYYRITYYPDHSNNTILKVEVKEE